MTLTMTGTPGASEVGVSYSYTPNTTYDGSATLSYSISPALPAGLAISSSTGAITGSPTVSGGYSGTITVTDGSANGTLQVSFTVYDAVVLSAAADQTITIGENFSYTVTPSNGLSPYTITSSGTLPIGIAFNAQTGTFSGAALSPVTATVTVKVVDSLGGTQSATFRLIVPTVTNLLYAGGFRVEQFRGVAGIGQPVFTSATSSDSNEKYGVGFVTLNSTTQNSDWGYNCLWMNFIRADRSVASLSSFWLTFEANIAYTTAATEAALAQYSPVVIRSTNGTSYLMMRAVPGGVNQYRVILTTSLTDSTQFVDTGIVLTSGGISQFNFHVTGAGTQNGTIVVFNSGLRSGSWSGDMTNYPGFNAVSFHKCTPSSPTSFYYVYVSNYSTRYSYLNFTTVKAVGTDQDWSGDTSTFGTYPVNYAAAGGFYAKDVGDKQTFTFNTRPADATGYIPASVIMSAALVTDDDSTVAQVGGVVYDPTSKNTLELAGEMINANGLALNWYLPQDPVTGNSWNASTIAAYEFGVERTE